MLQTSVKAWLAAIVPFSLRMTLRILHECPCEALRGVLRRCIDSYGIITRIKPVRPYMAFVSPLMVISGGTYHATRKPIAAVPPTAREIESTRANAMSEQVAIVDNNAAAFCLYSERVARAALLLVVFVCPSVAAISIGNTIGNIIGNILLRLFFFLFIYIYLLKYK